MNPPLPGDLREARPCDASLAVATFVSFFFLLFFLSTKKLEERGGLGLMLAGYCRSSSHIVLN